MVQWDLNLESLTIFKVIRKIKRKNAANCDVSVH